MNSKVPTEVELGNSPSRVQRVFARLQSLADAGWGGSVVFAWGLLQGCVFPGFADVFFLPLALARPQRAYVLALFATAGTLLGSVLLYSIGETVLSVLHGGLAETLGFTTQKLERYRSSLARHGAWAIFASMFSPLSTKLISLASGLVGVPWLEFTGALLAGRLLRTLGLAWIVRNGGAAALEQWIGTQTTDASASR